MIDLIVSDEHADDDAGIDDEEGRAALVETILKLAAKVHKQKKVRLFLGDGTDPLDSERSLKGRPLWLLAKFLCVLIVLDEAEAVMTNQVNRLAERCPKLFRLSVARSDDISGSNIPCVAARVSSCGARTS